MWKAVAAAVVAAVHVVCGICGQQRTAAQAQHAQHVLYLPVLVDERNGLIIEAVHDAIAYGGLAGCRTASDADEKGAAAPLQLWRACGCNCCCCWWW
jgi:hypothetical protein